MAKLKDLTGQRFGALTVLSRVPDCKRTTWRCVCDCGQETTVLAQSLQSGSTTSCGCHMHKLGATIDNPWEPGEDARPRITMKLDPAKDADIIRKLERVVSKQGYIKQLIREDIAMGETCLQDITRQESGIIIFDNNEAIVCNWAQIWDGLPRVFCGELVSSPCKLFVLDQGETKDFESFGADKWDVVYDVTGQAPALAGSSEKWKWYKVQAGDDVVTVIAPCDWN